MTKDRVRRPTPAAGRREALQLLLPFVPPIFYASALGALAKLVNQGLALLIGLLVLPGATFIAYSLRWLAKKTAAAEAGPLPRWLYLLAGAGWVVLTLTFARLAYRNSHAPADTGLAITAGFATAYCAVASVLALGRALARGRARDAFWLFLPRWLEEEEAHGGPWSGTGPIPRADGSPAASDAPAVHPGRRTRRRRRVR